MFKFLNYFINVFIYATVFVCLGQLFGQGKITWQGFPENWAFGFVLGMLILYLIPLVNWGIGLAMKLKCKPGSFSFRAVICLVFSFVFVLIEVIGCNLFGMTYLMGLPAIVALMASAKAFPLFWAVAFVLALIITNPVEAIARKITNTPAPQWGEHKDA